MKKIVITLAGIIGFSLLILLLASCTPKPEPQPVVYQSVCGDWVCSANEISTCDFDCQTSLETNPVITTPADVMEDLRNRRNYSSEERLDQPNAEVQDDQKIVVESFTSYLPEKGFRVASKYNMLSIGENISSVIGALNSFSLTEILRGGSLRSTTEAFGPRAALYSQFLKLRAGKVVFGFDEDNNVISTYLQYDEGEPIWDYALELQGGIFKFFENQTIHFLGHDYLITSVSNSSMQFIGVSTPDTIMFRNKHGVIINNKEIPSDALNVSMDQDTLRIILLADRDIKILPGTTLLGYLKKPELLLTNRLDLVYEGLTDVPIYDIKLEKSSTKYKLSFTTNKNRTYTLPFAYLSPLKLGDDNYNLVYKEGTNKSDYIIKKKDYFIISNNKQFNGLTNIIKLIDVDEENHLLTLEDPALEKFVIYFEGTPGTNATAELIVDRVKHQVYVGKNETIAVDLDGNGRISQDNVPIITAGNAIIRINKVYTDEINFSIITPKEMRENSKADLEINMLLKPYGLVIDKNDLAMLQDPASESLVGVTDYGALFVLTQNVDEDAQSGEDLIIKYPLVQRFADVIIKAYE